MSTPFYPVGDLWPSDEPGKRARMLPEENFVNSPYDTTVTENRILLPHPDDDKRHWIKEIKNRNILFMDPLQGSAENPNILYGFHYEHVNNWGAIDLLRIDEIEGVTGSLVKEKLIQNGVPNMDAFRDEAIKELNAASLRHEKRSHPTEKEPFDITNHYYRCYTKNLDIWKARVKHRFRIAGLVQYVPEVHSAADIIIYDSREKMLPVTTWTGGLTEVDDVWYPYLQYEPRRTNRLGFQITFTFEKHPTAPHAIQVRPRLVPAIAVNQKERLSSLDYYVGTVAYNSHGSVDRMRVSHGGFIQVQLDM